MTIDQLKVAIGDPESEGVYDLIQNFEALREWGLVMSCDILDNESCGDDLNAEIVYTVMRYDDPSRFSEENFEAWTWPKESFGFTKK